MEIALGVISKSPIQKGDCQSSPQACLVKHHKPLKNAETAMNLAGPRSGKPFFYTANNERERLGSLLSNKLTRTEGKR